MVCGSSGQMFKSLMCYQLKEPRNDINSGNLLFQYKSTEQVLVEINSGYHYVKDSVI